MLPSTMRYVLLLWLWPVCYGFVLMSSAAAGAGAAEHSSYTPGGSWEYELLTTVLLNEPNPAKDVGFQITGNVKVDSVWMNPTQVLDRLLKIELSSLQLHIKSRKAPAPEGFVSHKSKLEGLANAPFLVHWRQGKVQSIYIPLKEPLSMVNFKKGIASIFQYQLLDLQQNETDSSGHCLVSYRSTGPNTFSKTKTSCQASEDTPYLLHPDDLFSVSVTSSRIANYEMESDNSYVKHVKIEEAHVMTVNIRKEAGARVESSQELTFKQSGTSIPVKNERIEDAVQSIGDQMSIAFTHENLMTERETKMCQDNECPGFAKLVSENFANVAPEHYGKIKAATGFIRTLQAARDAPKSDISKVLKGKKFQQSLTSIYDILGSAQTITAHEAVMKTLQLTDDTHLDNIERYLWALAMGSHPKREIIKDLLDKYLRVSNLPDKVKETLILTIASMTDKYVRNPNNKNKKKIYTSVKEAIYKGLDSCDKQICQYYYIRALKNLRSEETVPKLLELALTAGKSSAVAMKALRSFPQSYWNSDVLKACERIFFQIQQKFDSSSRTLALDILITSKPSVELINHLVHYLSSNDKAFEVKKYLLQKLVMMSEKYPEFKNKFDGIVRKNSKLNNYAVLSQRGMSSALSRQFLDHPIANGSMISSQEMNSGLVKRGVFDIVLENDERSCEMFSLGLFSGGLSSFISSDDADEASDEAATAGMEITLLGNQIRPFVFFSGQGELMGHVWSGTASESTTAFQINTLLHDHMEYLRLSPGFIAELSLQTAISFNLAGEIQISLWNRNSHSLVTQNAGIVMVGLLRVDTTFVQSQMEFTMSAEPRLDLESDIEFGSGVAVCLRLTQPSTLYKHNIYKIERIPGSKHKLRKAKYKKIEIPGRTYNLNRKNNEMCSALMENR